MASSSEPPIREEADVTLRLRDWLQSRGWQVIAVHYPGSQAGLYIHPSDRTGRGAKGGIVVDLLAAKPPHYLVVESKVRFDRRDVLKLSRLLAERRYAEDLRRRLGIADAASASICPAIAVAGIDFARAKIPAGFGVFVVQMEGIRAFAVPPAPDLYDAIAEAERAPQRGRF